MNSHQIVRLFIDAVLYIQFTLNEISLVTVALYMNKIFPNSARRLKRKSFAKPGETDALKSNDTRSRSPPAPQTLGKNSGSWERAKTAIFGS